MRKRRQGARWSGALALAVVFAACQYDAPSPFDSAAGAAADSSPRSEGTDTEEPSSPSGDTADATGSDAGEVATCTPDLASIRAEIFTPRCIGAGCHSSQTAAGALDFETDDLEAQLVGIASALCSDEIRVVAGQPEASLLYTKVAGTASCGDPMPVGEPLRPSEVECIAEWIAGLGGVECETCGAATCVDLDNDATNCGGCANACPAGTPCQQGACQCPDSTEQCGDDCVDPASDPDHCGQCENVCPADQVCRIGGCSHSCANLDECDGACVDLQTDRLHCGTCGNACGEGVACEAGSCECSGNGVSFSADVEPLFSSYCTRMGCHRTPAPSAGLDLRPGQAWNDLVEVTSSQCGNRLLVAPGDPDASYLIDKLRGVDLCSGTKMPKTGPSPSQAEIDTITEWVCRGAAND